MITEQDIERARRVYDDAEDELLELGPARRRRLRADREGGAVRAAAEGRLRIAAEQLEALTTQREAEQADLADRPAREKAAKAYLAAAGKELAGSRKRVTEAAAAAQAALVELLDAGAAHDELAGRVAAELAGRGLTLGDGTGIDHKTGAAPGSGSLSGPVVRIRGAWWCSIGDPATLAVWVLHRVAVARLRRIHALAGLLKFFGRRVLLDARVDGLLDGVPDIPRAEFPEPPVVVRERVTGAPVGISEFRAEDERRLHDPSWITPKWDQPPSVSR